MKTVVVVFALAVSTLTGCAELQRVLRRAPDATTTLLPTQGSEVRGKVKFTRKGSFVEVVGRITGLTPGAHGLHVHEKGNCTAPDASSAGPHFNPGSSAHGGPHDAAHHGGDLGNIVADAEGVAEFSTQVAGITLGADAASIIGRSLVVHADADDLQSQPSGNSGRRLACGLISKAR